ncbi:Uncharacterized protein conserved in bacteria [Legionella beliardensis]|uniref:Uncharacterized protein conserved in bacteria n=1 Tax=Legionella beliardensis TaxID=91822 RepID=A0A378IBI9_9GAMM|nr:DUF2188 domain-containing protein [Legionella beliardensis]STX29664.1 Uncharacterized protein conserved in bacteria [Legionella beliardensis]
MVKYSGSHHVTPSADGGWLIKRSGSKRAFRRFDTKSEAVQAAREISRNQNTELFIHDKDGKIELKDSHGHDPYPPKG